MRDIFRALSNGEKAGSKLESFRLLRILLYFYTQEVERDRLKAMVKLVWSGRVNEAGWVYCCCDPPFPSSWVLFVGLWLEYDRQVAVDKAFETMAKEPLMEFGPCDLTLVRKISSISCCWSGSSDASRIRLLSLGPRLANQGSMISWSWDRLGKRFWFMVCPVAPSRNLSEYLYACHVQLVRWKHAATLTELGAMADRATVSLRLPSFGLWSLESTSSPSPVCSAWYRRWQKLWMKRTCLEAVEDVWRWKWFPVRPIPVFRIWHPILPSNDLW